MIKVTVSALGMSTEVFRIPKDQVTLGRGNTNDVPLQGIGISRSHCRAFVEGGQLFVEDTGSTNGTVIRGQEIEGPIKVSPGVPVDIGECRVLFQHEGGGVDEVQAPAERTVAIQAAVQEPRRSSGAVSRVMEELRAAKQDGKPTLARSPVAAQPVDRREVVHVVRGALDHLILDAAAAQFERELRSSAPPSNEALMLLKRMLLAEVNAMDAGE